MSTSVAWDLFNKLQTKERSNDFIRLFDYIEGLTHHVGGFNIEEVLKSVFGDIKPDWIYQFVKDMPSLESGNISDGDMNLLREVREMMEKSTVVKIEVNFPPSLEFVSNVIKILRENYGDMNFIIDVDVLENLESGAMFYIGGNVIDLTVRNKVTSYLITQDVINRLL
jgi:F0F1-type ATP synthase delta subunit